MNNNGMEIIVNSKYENGTVTSVYQNFMELKKLQEAGIASKTSGVMDDQTNMIWRSAGLYNDVESFAKGNNGLLTIFMKNDMEAGKGEIAESLSGVNPEDIGTVLREWNRDAYHYANHSTGSNTDSAIRFKTTQGKLFSQEEIEQFISIYTQGRQM